MRKSYLYLAAILLAAAGCAELQNNGIPEGQTQEEIRIGGDIHQDYATRVNDGGFCEGDKIGVFVVENQDESTPGTLLDKSNYADNIRYVLTDANANTWTPDKALYYPARKIDIYGYYPYTNVSSVNALPFEIAKDQSVEGVENALGGYEASDFLWGKAAQVSASTSKVNITFRHIMAAVSISLSEGTGWEDGQWDATAKDVLVINTRRSASIDLATGTVTATGAIQNTGTVPYPKTQTSFRAVVVPQTVAGGTAILNVTVGGKSLLFTPEELTEFSAGRQLNINLSVNKPADGSGPELELVSQSISEWENDGITHGAAFSEYVVVNCPEAGTLQECIAAQGQDLTKIKNLKVTGEIDYRDFVTMRYEMTSLQAINLKEVTIVKYNSYPDNAIPDYAFDSKSTLTRFVFPDKLTKIGSSAFYGTRLTGSLLIPDDVTEIGASAFNRCEFLNGILHLPKSLVTIGESAFYMCSILNGNLDIPESVKSIGSSAFSGCPSFTGELILPNDLETLGGSAFSDCSGFTGDLEIPHNITTIAGSTFYGTGLRGQLTLPADLVAVSNFAFEGCRFTGSLVLPETLVSIGSGAFSNNNFSGELIIPSSVQTIGAHAFEKNRFSGTLELPEGITMIHIYCFSDNAFEKIILPSTVESIDGPFGVNPKLKEIVCKSVSVPYTKSASLVSVPSTAVIKVPFESLNDYKTAAPWNTFAANMVPYYNLSLSRDLAQVLNASKDFTVSLYCESNEAWEIQSLPEWADVTPTSGTGPCELTVTVAELPAGQVDRKGEMIVKLSDEHKVCHTAMAIDQYNYQLNSSAVDVVPEESEVQEGEAFSDGNYIMTYKHTKGNGVPLVFMGEGYTASEIQSGKYVSNMKSAIGHFFDVEPYTTYKEYFDVYIILALSDDSGIFGPNDKKHDTKFKNKYSKGIGYEPDEAICFDYVIRLPHIGNSKLKDVLVTLVMNTNEYSGVTHMWSDGKAISCVPVSTNAYPYDFRGYVQHEACGHGFGKLGDENYNRNGYLQESPSYQEFKAQKSYGWLENLSDNSNRAKVPWAIFLEDDDYNQIVDMFEGGYSFSSGVYRSELNSCMNNYVPYFSAISRMAIVKRIMSIAGETFTYEGFKAKDVKTASVPSVSSSGPAAPFAVPAGVPGNSPVVITNYINR